MGSAQSSDIKKREAAGLASTSSSDAGSNNTSSSDNWETTSLVKVSIFEEDSGEELTDGEDDDDDHEYIKERLRVLEDSRKLKMMADFFLHPEKPVKTIPVACGRCYFDRYSAAQPVLKEEDNEVADILEDMLSLKQLAVNYRHPEIPMTTSDPTATARCYFDRASAPEVSPGEEEEEKTMIFAELKRLKRAAYDYLHPEAPVVASDPAVFGRNYFTRPTAPIQTTMEEEQERQLILEDAKALKKLATDYQHPELPVVTCDPTLFGRNYFTRASAPEQELETERELILEDAMALKKLATDYQHPELPVVTSDPTLFGRNYFTRASAPEQEVETEVENIVEDAKRLEKLAELYYHPELPIETMELTNYEESDEMVEGDLYYHHAHFDMDDDIHLHHVEFDRNMDHHDQITEVQISSPTPTRAVVNDFDVKLSMSPGCVMTFAQPVKSQLPHAS